MKIIRGDLILKEDTTFNEDLKVEGNIYGKNRERYNLIVNGDLNCKDLDCFNLNCKDLNCLDLDCFNLDCKDLNCENLDCWDLNCENLNFYAIAIAYNSFKCKSWKARRENNYIIKCLDGEIEIKDKKICDKCGQEVN